MSDLRWGSEKIVPIRPRRYRRPYTDLAAFLACVAVWAAGILTLTIVQHNFWIFFAGAVSVPLGRAIERYTRAKGGWH
jgi:hypothetical protein